MQNSPGGRGVLSPGSSSQLSRQPPTSRPTTQLSSGQSPYAPPSGGSSGYGQGVGGGRVPYRPSVGTNPSTPSPALPPPTTAYPTPVSSALATPAIRHQLAGSSSASSSANSLQQQVKPSSISMHVN